MMINKSILILGFILLVMTSTSHANSGPMPGYYVDDSDNLLKGRFGQCFRTTSWEPKHAISECESAEIVDSDKDGVMNSADACPNNKAGLKVDSRGCEIDSDNDGLANSLDSCPNTPANAKVDATGCSILVKLDSDGDGDGDSVADSKDQCANTTAGVKVNSSGCELDSDGDGIADSRDQCANTAAGYKVDGTGCVLAETLAVKSIIFDVNSDQLQHGSIALLDKITQTLKLHPDMIVEIAGFADSSGNKNSNQVLSEKRAMSVVNFLTENGVSPTSVQAKGYGITSPIADNTTASGRSKNRRVELSVVQQPRTQEFQFVMEQ